jgi:hypothetical protein
MDFASLKKQIREIADVVALVPDRFQDRCFDALLTALLRDLDRNGPTTELRDDATPPDTPAGETSLPLRGQMVVFMQRTKLESAQLSSVVSYVDGEVHFLREPSPTTTAKGQMQWALLYALKNAIENNSFSLDASEFTEILDDKGFYDRKNYWAIFERNGGAVFQKAPSKDQPKQTLSVDGQNQLAELVRALAG